MHLIRPAFFVFGGLLAGVAQANTLYRCVDADGSLLYTNQKQAKLRCDVLSVMVPPTPSGGAAPAPRKAAQNQTPADFPKVSSSEQSARDKDRRSILEAELASERGHLESARRQLSDAARQPSANAQPLKDKVALHERNIEALTKEIGKLR